MIVLIAAVTANLKTPCGRPQTLLPPAKRLTSNAPAIASRVLPLATATDVKMSPAVVRLTKNAPTKIAGHTRKPNKSNAASAIPAGGHTGDALACNDARFK